MALVLLYGRSGGLNKAELELDWNTAVYMVDVMQKEIDEQKHELEAVHERIGTGSAARSDRIIVKRKRTRTRHACYRIIMI